MYTLFCGGWSKQFPSWWELIGYIKQGDYDKRYAHNPNDCIKYKDLYTYRILDDGYRQFKISSTPRDCIAYDDDMVVNLTEIREGLQKHHDIGNSKRCWYRRQKCYFEYRKEPVPGTGNYPKTLHWKISKHSYRSSWIKAFDGQYLSDFQYPKAKNYLALDIPWDDEIPRRSEKNWKSQGKKRHQWEKK